MRKRYGTPPGYRVNLKVDMALFARRACPICSGHEPHVLFRQSFEQLSDARLVAGYDVVVCADCGAGFADGIPEQATFDRYYRELSKYDYNDRIVAQRPKVDRRFVDTADSMQKSIPSRHARILEIGSASGELLNVLAERGFTNLVGVDPSPGCCRAAREIYGIECHVGTVFVMPLIRHAHDFLILVGVMEHIRDIDIAARRLRSLLGAHGRVYLEVPDASRFTAAADAPFQEFSVEHVNFLSLQSLTNLMLINGFRPIETGRAVRGLNDIAVPVAYGCYEKTSESGPIVKDMETEPALRAYIAGGLEEDSRIRAKIEGAIGPGERIIVWGVGTHTQRLLANGGLNPEKVALFVDSNAKYQRQHLLGIPVVAPEELRDRSEAILISSRGLQQEIYGQIRQRLAIPNTVIRLYT